MKKYIIMLLFLLFVGCSNINKSDIYYEECRVIRDNDKIIGIKYIITILDNTDLDEVIIYPKIYNSIYHYTDISKLLSLDVYIEIHNNSDYNYLLRNIYLNDTKKYNYNKIVYKDKIDVIYYYLDNSFLKKYSEGFNYKIIFSKEN